MEKRYSQRIVALLVMVMIILLGGCNSSATNQPAENPPAEKAVAAGTYTAKAAGYHGDLEVTTEVDQEGKITKITIGENTETEDVGGIAMEKIPQRIIEAQSLDVDVIAGATLTSKGIINGVAAALKEAGADPVHYGYVAPEEESEAIMSPLNKSALPVKKETTGSITIKDVKGREVTLDLPISSYAISTMDVIDYIIPLKGEEAFAMLVASGQDGGGGIQKYAQLYKPIVGDYTQHLGQISDHNAPFDLEMVLSMNPDVLIVNSAMAAHKYALEIEEQLTAAGISIVLIDVPGKTLDKSVQETMKLLGKIFQEEEKAAEVAAFIDKQYELLAAKNLAQRQNKPKVYYEKSGYSEVYGSTGTSVSGWGLPIAIAGGDNIADAVLLDKASAGGSSNTLDPEYVIKADPDYIILSGVNDGWLDSLKQKKEPPQYDIINRTGWSNLQAVKNNNVYEFAHSTSRSIYAFYPCLKMAKLFYPEEFKDLNPEAVLDEFFDQFMLVGSDISTWFTGLEDRISLKK
ncbi:ABC transporter substrate-binding protein [Desulfitobacterium hafniense]|nr:ABC transporter substrate-binding protein [Desulfitobacterium hafniense]EHL05283.1 FMN-binding domain protein [Desulfitobacterium hafniense DP7]KTE93248.1 FMN-binding protein [Desulfitobacterium hafniense]MEA5022732.1 ABC transporter substrate-binding protein [Desulfitobacterium hafniense]CDX00065.1 FMN-binding domain protein [Desulfitobacterium hafniense]